MRGDHAIIGEVGIQLIIDNPFKYLSHNGDDGSGTIIIHIRSFTLFQQLKGMTLEHLHSAGKTPVIIDKSKISQSE